MTKKDSNTNNQEGFSKMSISWARRHLVKPTSNLHKISILEIRLFAYCEKSPWLN